MTLQILGSACPNCLTLEANVREALADRGLDHKVEKVTDIDEIVELGVFMIPALVIDGEVKSSGKALSKAKIFQILDGED